MPKIKEKELATNLRKQGLSYSEVLRQVPVAKSTLSLWLREVGLSKPQKQRLTKRKLEAALRGSQKRREMRIALVKEIEDEAIREIKNISQKELWLMGIMLYWAEGTKEKENNIGMNLQLGNSDPYIIKLFLKWALEILKVEPSMINFVIYIHENHKNRVKEVKKYWSDISGFSINDFKTVYFKKHNIKTIRKKVGKDYKGLLKVTVRASSSLNRKVAGWVKGINKYYFLLLTIFLGNYSGIV